MVCPIRFYAMIVMMVTFYFILLIMPKIIMSFFRNILQHWGLIMISDKKKLVARDSTDFYTQAPILQSSIGLLCIIDIFVNLLTLPCNRIFHNFSLQSLRFNSCSRGYLFLIYYPTFITYIYTILLHEYQSHSMMTKEHIM